LYKWGDPQKFGWEGWGRGIGRRAQRNILLYRVHKIKRPKKGLGEK
jgi:hypothetical protein